MSEYNYAETLTACYLAKGFDAADNDAQNRAVQTFDDGGELGFIAACLMPLAKDIEAFWVTHFQGDTLEWDGVWDYEVAEPLGQWFTEQAATGRMPTAVEIDAKIRELSRLADHHAAAAEPVA